MAQLYQVTLDDIVNNERGIFTTAEQYRLMSLCENATGCALVVAQYEMLKNNSTVNEERDFYVRKIQEATEKTLEASRAFDDCFGEIVERHNRNAQ